ncbi:hypothetical protein OG320_10610 [Microbispora sp. NBC_01189]|uniref:hypothetical protein n=1 Tax=Microbispora sp. NBC_01189 TaxID=2903583 RepID=UPI002E0D5485|nr:hypothetical protein OG320_10610 [Microbispora sp. NBC_01189]
MTSVIAIGEASGAFLPSLLPPAPAGSRKPRRLRRPVEVGAAPVASADPERLRPARTGEAPPANQRRRPRRQALDRRLTGG